MLSYKTYTCEVNKNVRTDRLTKCDDDRMMLLTAILPPEGLADIVIDYTDNNVHAHTTFWKSWTGLGIRYPDSITQRIDWWAIGYNSKYELIGRVHYRTPCSPNCPTYGGLGRIRLYIGGHTRAFMECVDDAFVTEVRGPFDNKGVLSASFFARPREASFYIRWQAGSTDNSSSVTWFSTKTMQENYRIILPNDFAWKFWHVVRSTSSHRHAEIPNQAV